MPGNDELGSIPQYQENEPFLEMAELEGIDTGDLNEGDFKRNDPRKTQFLNAGKDNEGNPKWNSVSFKDFLSKTQLENLKNSLETVKNAIQKIDDILEGARTLIDIIKQIEELLEDVIGGILKQIIKILETLLNNVASSGVYYLDMTNHFRKQGSSIDGSNNKIPISSYYKEDFLEYLNSYVPDIEDRGEAVKKQPTDEEKQDRDNVKKALMKLLPFEQVSYEEWINIVAEAFVDENDVADEGALNRELNYKNRVLSKMSEEKSFKDFRTWYETVGYEGIFRGVGAPKWGPGSRSTVFVISVNFTNLLKGADSIDTFWDEYLRPTLEFFFDENIVGEISPTSKSKESEPQESFLDKLKKVDVAGGFSSAGEAIKNSPGAIGNAVISGAKAVGGGIRSGINSLEEKIKKEKAVIEYNNRYQRISPPPQEPNFYGSNLETLIAADFWKESRSFLQICRNLTEKSSDSWSDAFEDMLNEIQIRVNKIKRFMKVISNIISFIEKLQNLSFNVLVINSKDGVYDIYDQLQSATGFPGQEENESSLILGMVLAAGVPSPDLKDSTLNFGDFLKDMQKAVDQETGELVDAYGKDSEPRDGGEAALKKLMSFFKK